MIGVCLVFFFFNGEEERRKKETLQALSPSLINLEALRGGEFDDVIPINRKGCGVNKHLPPRGIFEAAFHSLCSNRIQPKEEEEEEEG